MKRPLLATGLLVAFVGVVAYGTHYGPEHALQNGLARFRAALPPDSTLEYTSARPDLLARGAHLTDVTLHIHDVTYRAHEVHLGHVSLSSTGEISFTRLDLTNPSIEAPTYNSHATAIHLHGLIIPPDHGAGLNAIAIANTVLDRGDAQGLSVHLTHSPDGKPSDINIANTTLAHYGKGQTTAITFNTAQITHSLAPYGPMLVSFDSGSMTLPDIASKLDNTDVQKHTPLTDKTSLTLNNSAFISGNMHLSVEKITLANKAEADIAHSLLNAQGFHFRIDGKTSPVPINGAATTLSQDTSIALNTDDTTSQLTLNIPNFVNVSTSIHIQKGPAHPQEAPNAPAEPLLHNIHFTLAGERFLHAIPAFLAGHALSPAEQDAGYAAMQARLHAIVQGFPASAPVADFVASPHGRTLTLDIVPPMPLPVAQLPALAQNPMLQMLLFSDHVMTFSVQ